MRLEALYQRDLAGLDQCARGLIDDLGGMRSRWLDLFLLIGVARLEGRSFKIAFEPMASNLWAAETTND
jgi:hypothetical protein